MGVPSCPIDARLLPSYKPQLTAFGSRVLRPIDLLVALRRISLSTQPGKFLAR